MRLFAVLALAAAIACSPSLAQIQTEPSYPTEIADFGETQRFPMEAAGYHRGRVTAYAPALADYSVAYSRLDAELQNAVTLYFYSRPTERDDQILSEKAQVKQIHPDAQILSERTVTLSHGSKKYEATVVDFEFRADFVGRTQIVFSELLLVFEPPYIFKMRSTAPRTQSAAAKAGLEQLLAAVTWAR